MIAPTYPENEAKRQAAVEKYKLLDTLEEEAYDNITSLVSYVCNAPIALITLLDKERNFLKSHYGIPFNESPRNISFCGHAINSNEDIFVVEDARVDKRFMDNPLVEEHKAVFYAGVPLVDTEGYKLGTLCVYDNKPRKLTTEESTVIKNMAKQVMLLFEQRYQNFKLEKYKEDLKKRNDNLQKFSGVVSHDLKSPLSNIISLAELLEDENKDCLTEESLEYIEHLKTSSYTLKEYIDGLLRFYKSDELLVDDFKAVAVNTLINKVVLISDANKAAKVTIITTLTTLLIKEAPVMHILTNMFTNAIKYNSNPDKQITVSIDETDRHYVFEVKDNADGIPKTYIDKIFDLFVVGKLKDKDGNFGTGIGLATVKKIVDHLGGTVSVISEPSKGSVFRFTIAKTARL